MNQEAINTKESLRRNTIVLLYLNLIGNIWGLTTACGKFNNLSYKQFLHDEISIMLDFALIVIGSVVYFNTFVAIHNAIASSIRLLWAAIVFSMLDAFYMVYGTIQMHSNDKMKELFHIMAQKNVAKTVHVEQSSYWFPVESFSSSMLFVVVSLVIGLAFKLYSALIFHIYKLLLQRWPDSSSTFLRNDLSVPSVYTVQFADPHCVSQSPQYINQNPLSMQHGFPQQTYSLFETSRSLYQPHQFTHQSSNVPFSFASQFPSKFNSLTVPNQCPDVPPQYPNQLANIQSINPN